MSNLKNRNIYILVILLVILVFTNYKPVPSIAIGDISCFEKEDCKQSIHTGYCDIKYDCVVGKCYIDNIRCPEICSGGIDEDMNGLIDCDDTACFNSIYCDCSISGYTHCYPGQCYCQSGSPQWWSSNNGNGCQCIWKIE